jgi:hypothetical protein
VPLAPFVKSTMLGRRFRWRAFRKPTLDWARRHAPTAVTAVLGDRARLLSATRRAGAAATTVGSPICTADFIDLADLVGPAEIVTLDRVINVHPGWERLAVLAAVRAKRLFGLGYPRATRVVRVIIVVMNLILRLKGKPVRVLSAMRSSGSPARTVSHLTSRRMSAPRGRSRSFAENEPSARTDEAIARLPMEGELNG